MTQPDTPPEIIEAYQTLRDLIRSDQTMVAEKFFDKNNLVTNWESLLHYSMMRRNCPVSIIILKRVIANKQLTRDEIRLKVSKLLQDISFDFSQRMSAYVKSEKFGLESVDAHHSPYHKVMAAVDTQLKARTGKGLMNPNQF